MAQVLLSVTMTLEAVIGINLRTQGHQITGYRGLPSYLTQDKRASNKYKKVIKNIVQQTFYLASFLKISIYYTLELTSLHTHTKKKSPQPQIDKSR